MLKRTLALILGLLFLAGTALADLPDFASMSFDELNTMKQALDKEYFSRPESSGYKLSSGEYVAGKNILPGFYYYGMVTTSPNYAYTSVTVKVNNYKTKCEEILFFGSEPKTVSLDEGDKISIEGADCLFRTAAFQLSDYYSYEPPKGTTLQVGTYRVPEDVPVGNYAIYAGVVTGGKYKIYVEQTNDDGTVEQIPKDGTRRFEEVYIFKDLVKEHENLVDGDIIVVQKPIHLVRPEKPIF